MSRDMARRLRALEMGRRLASGWDYSGLSDDDVCAMIGFRLRIAGGEQLPVDDQRRLGQLNGMVVRNGPPPFAHLSDEELNRRIIAITAEQSVALRHCQ